MPLPLLSVDAGYDFDLMLSQRAPLLLALGAFVVTFALTRAYTRFARIYGWGSGSVGGVHLHHMVVGIIMVLVTGLVAVAFWPEGTWGRSLLGIFFGVGAALTLDEFALWLYLRDVYWCPEGRSSIDATVLAVVIAALLLAGSSPFGLEGGRTESAIAFAVIAVNVLAAVVTLLKGKLTLGLAGIFVPVLGIVCAVRLARPRSLWAKHVYSTRAPAKLERARERFEAPGSRYRRFHDRLDDVLGGAPSLGAPPSPLPVTVRSGRLQGLVDGTDGPTQ